jgi:hypothetical protein
VKRVLDEDF